MTNEQEQQQPQETPVRTETPQTGPTWTSNPRRPQKPPKQGERN